MAADTHTEWGRRAGVATSQPGKGASRLRKKEKPACTETHLPINRATYKSLSLILQSVHDAYVTVCNLPKVKSYVVHLGPFYTIYVIMTPDCVTWILEVMILAAALGICPQTETSLQLSGVAGRSCPMSFYSC